MKTVRFAEVVRRAGVPAVHVSWLPPARDPELQRALAEHRVLTIHQRLRGTRKDFGTVGLHRKGPGQTLIFPRPLRRFADRRVIAIDYQLLPASPAAKPPGPGRIGGRRASPAIESRRRKSPRAGRRTARLADRPRKLAPARARENPPGSTEARAARSVSTPAVEPPSREALLRGIRQAAADLQAGRAVPAYERLRGLLQGDAS